MNIKKYFSIILILSLIINIFIPIVTFATTNTIEETDNQNQDVFYDDFSGDKLDTTKWLIAEKAWGGNNGGVVSENVSVSDGLLKLEGHGDKYEGDVEGINKPDGKRTGGAISTKEYFGSGSYEVVAKVCPELGACSAIWTFEYEEYYPGDEKYEELAPGGSYYAVNHEIDIEMPGRPGAEAENISYNYALCNTWVGERNGEYTTSYTELPSAQNDGKFHTYRFDWHTGDEDEIPRVEFYIDGQLVKVNTTHIPTNKGRFWIGLWFPNGWAGTPDFDTEIFEIDSVKITPFNEAGDTNQNETYGDDGWHDPELDKTAQEVIQEMGAGWNLGNTLDSCDYKKQYQGQDNSVEFYETLWQNPQATEELISEVKKSGFNSVRVPVTYYDHCDEKGIIDEVWLNRVEEVVNYVLNNNMYCVLDVHHDTGLCDAGSWIVADADKYEENAYKLRKLWEQIAARFKDYDYKLIFEGFNEIVDSQKNYDWVTGYDATVNVNKLNQVFVDTIRESGGKNKNRFLAVTTFGGITDEQKLSTFEMPQDTAKNKIILALHDYSSDSQNITEMFERIKKYCTDKDIPVILDEFGTTSFSMSEEDRAKIAEEYVSKAKALGIACFWWDDGGNYILYDRQNMNWKYEKIKDAIVNQYKDNNPDKNPPDENPPEENEPDDNKPDDNKPDDSKPSENEPDDNKSDDNKPSENEPDDNKPDDEQPNDENKPEENEPDVNKPNDNQVDDNQPSDDKPTDNQPDNNKPAEKEPDQNQSDNNNKPDYNKQDDNKPNNNQQNENKADNAPINNNKPTESKPTNNQTNNDKSTANKSTDNKTIENKSNNLNNNNVDDGRYVGTLPYAGSSSYILQILILIMSAVTILIYIKITTIQYFLNKYEIRNRKKE